MNTAPTCTHCTRPLFTNEADRHLCRPCQRRTDQHLAELPHLAQLLTHLLEPAARRTTPRHATHTSPPAPCNLDVLDLLGPGGIPAVTSSWVRDWCDHLGWQPPTPHTDPLTQNVAFLRTNLPWAAERHHAIGDFATEIRDLRDRILDILEPEQRARTVGTCPGCAHPLRYRPGNTTVRCSGCGSRWDPLDARALAHAAWRVVTPYPRRLDGVPAAVRVFPS